MTFDQAAGRWWREVGINRGDAADVERRLTRLIALIGKGTTLANINQTTVSEAIEARKTQGMRRAASKDAKVYFPSNSTINRDVIETLRPVLRRAKTHWCPTGSTHGLPEINWGELRLSEPRGLSRSYSEREQDRWLAAATELEVGLALEMLLDYGLRLGELLFGLDHLGGEVETPVLVLQKGRKRDVRLEVALTVDHGRQLAARAARARLAELDTVWFVQDGLNRDGTEKLAPMTYAMLEYRLSKAADMAGIPGGRRIHGARHHAGSAMLRDTKNLKAVQSLLGHATIQSSQRYTSVLNSELREAIEARTKRKGRFGTSSGEVGDSPPNGPDMFRSGESSAAGQKPRKR